MAGPSLLSIPPTCPLVVVRQEKPCFIFSVLGDGLALRVTAPTLWLSVSMRVPDIVVSGELVSEVNTIKTNSTAC